MKCYPFVCTEQTQNLFDHDFSLFNKIQQQYENIDDYAWAAAYK